MSWPSFPIGQLLTDVRPGFASGDDVADGVLQVRMNNVTVEGEWDFSRKRRVPCTAQKLQSFAVEPGDVLFNATNSPELVGKTAVFERATEPVVFSNHFLRLRPCASRLVGRFLARWLQMQFKRRVFQGMCRQWVNQATVSRDSLLSLLIPLPSLPEQNRIADILDRADALRAQRRAALAQLDSLPQAIFLKMFGDPTSNPNRFPVSTVGELTAVQGGLQLSGNRKCVGASVPYLRVANVYRNRLDLGEIKHMTATANEVARTRLFDGDILVVEGHGNPNEIGRAAIWRGEIETCVHQNHLIRIRVSGSDLQPQFLCHLLNSVGGRRHLLRSGKTTSGLNTISVSEVRCTPIFVPPNRLQREFANRVKAIERLQSAHALSVKNLDALFSSLQHSAFRGEL